MVDVKNKRCDKEDCSKHPSFDALSGEKGEFCATHAPAGTVQVKTRWCVKGGCFKQPSFGAAGGKMKKLCATHGQADMVGVNTTRCHEERCSKRSWFSVACGRKTELCAIHVQTDMDHQSASHRCVDRVREHGNTCVHAELELAVSSNAAGHVQEKYHLTDDLTVGETSVGTDGRGEGRSNSSDAGPNANDGDRDIHGRLRSRPIRARRRGGIVTPTPPAALGQPPDAAAADWVPFDSAETRMNLEVKTTAEPARVPEVVRNNGKLLTAQLSSCDSMDNGSSRGTAMETSWASSISIGMGTKRLRRGAQVEPVFVVAAGKDGANVKLELGVSAPCGHVPASLSRPREG
ncbi:unnamed protein product [Sphacelaria rigidula]